MLNCNCDKFYEGEILGIVSIYIRMIWLVNEIMDGFFEENEIGKGFKGWIVVN